MGGSTVNITVFDNKNHEYKIKAKSNTNITEKEEFDIKDFVKRKFSEINTQNEKEFSTTINVNNREINIIVTEGYLQSVEGVAPIEEGFFDKLVSNFIKFFIWIFNIDDPAKVKDLELAFAMLLFKNPEADMYLRLKESKSDLSEGPPKIELSMADTLKIWSHFFTEILPYCSDEEKNKYGSLLPALKDLETYQRRIDDINDITDTEKRIEERNKLSGEMNEKVETLKENEKFYMPGGYLTDTGKDNVHMIFEICRGGKKKATVRVIDLSAIGTNPKEDQSFSIQDYTDFINKALKAQTGPLSTQKYSFFENIGRMMGIKMDELQFKERKTTLNAITKKDEEVKRSHVEPERVVRTLFKSVLGNLPYRSAKNFMRSASFLSLYRQIKTRLHDPAIRQWMGTNAKTLLDSLNKNTSEKEEGALWDPKRIEYLTNELQNIIQEIEKLDQQQATALPSSPKTQLEHSYSFGEPVNIPSQACLDDFKIVSSGLDPAYPLLPPKSKEPQKVFEYFRNAMDTIQEYVDEGDWKNSALLLEDMSGLLDGLKKTPFLGNLSKEQIKGWSQLVRDFGMVIFQVSLGMGNLVPTPSFIHYGLQSVVLSDMICRKQYSRYFETFHFDVIPYQNILKDSYLSLGSAAPKIKEDIDYLVQISQQNPTKISLQSLSPEGDEITEQPQIPNELKFFEPIITDYENNGLIGKIPAKDFYGDMGQKNVLPPEISHIRQLYHTTLMMMAPHRTLLGVGIFEAFDASFQFISESARSTKEEATQKLEQDITMKMFKKIRTFRGPITFKEDFWGFKFIVQPFGFFLSGIDTTIKPLPIYEENGVPVADEAKNLFESKVGQEQAPWVDEDGTPQNDQSKKPKSEELKSQKPKYDLPGAVGNTQIGILRQETTLTGLSSEVIKDLQLMQTGPATIIKETVGKLFKHAGLLNEGRHAPLLQRLFERNFFRNNALIDQLVQDPSYAKTLFASLKEIAEGQKDANNIRSYLFVTGIMTQINNSLDAIEGRLDEQYKPAIQDLKPIFRNYLDKAAKEIRKLIDQADRGDQTLSIYQRDLHLYSLLLISEHLLPRIKLNEPNPVSEDLALNAMKSYFLLQSMPEVFPLDPQKKAQADYFMHYLRPLFSKAMRDKGTDEDKIMRNRICNELFHLCKPGNEQNLEWRPSRRSDYVFRSNGFTLDLKEGVFWENNMRFAQIPGSVIRHPQFEQFKAILRGSGFEGDLSSIFVKIQLVEGRGSVGHQYTFSLTNKQNLKEDFRIIWTEDNTLRCYKKIEDKWFQFQPGLIPQEEEKDKSLVSKAAHSFPRVLEKYECWVDEDSKLLRAEKNGVPYYEARLKGDPPTIERLWKIDGKDKLEVLNPWDQPEFNIFKVVEDPAHVTVLGDEGKANKIVYNRFNLSYEWNTQKEKWISAQHPGYYISSKSLRGYSTITVNEAPTARSALQEIFSGSFTNYQLLESDVLAPKVILACTPYSRKGDPEANKFMAHIQTRTHQLYPEFHKDQTDKLPLFTYTADPNKGLVCADPDGYTYLAYALFVQGKYKEALRYLKKGDINRPSRLGNEIMKWMVNFPDSSLSALAIKAHVQAIKLRQENFTKQGVLIGEDRQQEEKYILQYKENESKIPVALRLSEDEKNAVPFSTNMQSEKDPVSSSTNMKSEKDPFSFFKRIKTEKDPVSSLTRKVETKEDVAKNLKEEIKELSEKIDKLSKTKNSIQQASQEKEIVEIKQEKFRLLSDVNLENWKPISNPGVSGVSEEIKAFKEGVTKTEEKYAKKIGEELVEDLEVVASESEKKERYFIPRNATENAPDISVDGLLNKLKKPANDHEAAARKHKLAVLNLLPKPQPTNAWDELQEMMKKQHTSWQEAVFDIALRCAGEGDWTELAELYNSKEDFKPIAESCKDYLKESSCLNYCVKAADSLNKLNEKNDKNEFVIAEDSDDYRRKCQEIHDLLDVNWSYDPDNDPHAITYLLIEYELGFVCRPNQIGVVKSIMEDDNQFKQETPGGGKTTVIRNIITHQWADGMKLAGVSTLESLRQEHGPLFSRTTGHAYGEKTMDFIFTRQTPSDELSLLKLHRNLLKTIVGRGRIDLTKGDLQSFKLAMSLKQEQIIELRKGEPADENKIGELNLELDVMEDIRDLLKTRAHIYADELDKDCDVIQEKNYAYGIRENLNEKKIGSGIELMELILNANEDTPNLLMLKKALLNNTQTDLEKKVADAARQELAGLVFEKYKNELNLNDTEKQPFIDYMTEIKTDENMETEVFTGQIVDFYKYKIQPNEKDVSNQQTIKEKLCFMHEFLVLIIPNTLSKDGKKGGVNFGRSANLLHVIPYEGSDRPKEGSEHSLESERIWYTLMDYVNKSEDRKGKSGIIPEQINLYVDSLKKEAAEELKAKRKSLPEQYFSFEETETAMNFQNKFRISLSIVSEKDFSTIADIINSKTEDLLTFVKTRVFSEYKQSPYKIVSNSQDPPSMVKSYSGSSGTILSKHTLPDQVDISNVKQKGVEGIIIESLLKIEKNLGGQNSFIPYAEKTKNDKFSLLDTLAREIKGGDCLSDVGVAFPGVSAVDIARSIAKLRPALTIKFMTRNDEWKMLKDGKVIANDPNIPLKEIFTIFDDAHTRGAERPSTDGVTEFITISESTTWSKFEQGVMRERGVTKGQANVRYLIPSTLQKQWGQNSSLTDNLFPKLNENEAAKQKPDNLKAEKQKIPAIPKHAAEDALREATRESRKEGQGKHWKARELIYQQIRSYSVKPTEAKAEEAGKPLTKKKSGDVLTGIIDQEEKAIEKIVEQLSSKAEDIINNFIKQFKNQALPKLEAKKSTVASDQKNMPKPRIADELIPLDDYVREGAELNSEQAVEQEQELRVEMELPVQTEIEKTGKIDKEINHRPLGIRDAEWKTVVDKFFNWKPPTHFYYKDAFYDVFIPFSKYASHLPPNKFYSENFCHSVRGGNRGIKPWTVLKAGEKMPPDQNRISRTLFIIHQKTNKVIEIVTSLKDNDTDIEEFVRNNANKAMADGYVLSIYNYETGKVDGGTGWDGLTKEQALAVNRQIVSTKFQNGDVNFEHPKKKENPNAQDILEDQYSALVDWLRDINKDLKDGGVYSNRLKSTYQQFISVYRPENVRLDRTRTVLDAFAEALSNF